MSVLTTTQVESVYLTNRGRGTGPADLAIAGPMKIALPTLYLQVRSPRIVCIQIRARTNVQSKRKRELRRAKNEQIISLSVVVAHFRPTLLGICKTKIY